jgi:hypothetical protein
LIVLRSRFVVLVDHRFTRKAENGALSLIGGSDVLRKVCNEDARGISNVIAAVIAV